MTKSNWAAADQFQREYPHTFNAMQALIMSMADAYNTRGKVTLFGHDRGLKNHKKFEEKLKDTLFALAMDGVVARTATAHEYWEALGAAVNTWAQMFPTWPDAYAFAREQFGSQQDGKRLIKLLMGLPN